MGIDTLHLGVFQTTPFRPNIVQIMRGIDWRDGSRRFVRSKHYAGIIDLRPLGIDALLHAYNRHTQSRDHKLELINAGKKNYSELVQQIESVFETDADTLRVMRLDLCADMFGVHVSWFQPRARIRYKRFAREIGALRYEQMGERAIQTLVAGKRPNVFRFYDKVAECLVDFKKRCRRTSEDADELNFEREYGFPADAVLTRVERQMGGGRIPEPLSPFGRLTRTAPEFNPFEPMEIVSGHNHSLPALDECGWSEWVMGTRLNELACEWGMQQLHAVINRKTKGNALVTWLDTNASCQAKTPRTQLRLCMKFTGNP
jgi:hypothetical protein